MSFIVKGGFVIDPANDREEPGDVCFTGGTITSSSEAPSDSTIIDAEGLIVTPGLIDLHIHGYEYATPLGVNPDQACLPFGVTTVCDAGSAGACTLPGLRKYIIEKSETNVLAFVHIATHGLAAGGCSGFGKGGECDSLNQVDVDQCVKSIEANRDIVVGVKVRLSADCADDGKNETEIYRRAMEVSQMTNLPLMVHHTFSTIPLEEGDAGLGCPGSLRAGDIYTHTYHGYPSTIIDSETGKVHEAVWAARKKGVLFDVGHGQGSFNWTVAEICAKESFFPDIISTDLHSGNSNIADGPVYDLPHVMSKFVHLGMRPQDVIRATTATPARALNRSDTLGSLGVGRTADIVVWQEITGDFVAEDCQAQSRHIQRILKPVVVFRKGVRVALHTSAGESARVKVCSHCGKGERDYRNGVPSDESEKTSSGGFELANGGFCRSPSVLAKQAKEWNKLVVKDEHPPQYLE